MRISAKAKRGAVRKHEQRALERGQLSRPRSASIRKSRGRVEAC